jgi:hypothetical protein
LNLDNRSYGRIASIMVADTSAEYLLFYYCEWLAFTRVTWH